VVALNLAAAPGAGDHPAGTAGIHAAMHAVEPLLGMRGAFFFYAVHCFPAVLFCHLSSPVDRGLFAARFSFIDE